MKIKASIRSGAAGLARLPGDAAQWFNADIVGSYVVGEYRGAPDFAFEPVAGVESVQGRQITNLAFDLRFTEAERVDIKRASLGDSDAALTIAVRLERASKATFTDLDDPVTRAGVEGFEAFGLIDEGRAAEILDAPIQESERP